MEITKNGSDFGYTILLTEDKNSLSFFFGRNLDLYISIWRKEKKYGEYNYDSFTITKENYEVYSLFEQLFYDIENINIFGEEDRKERLYRFSNYNKLYDNNNKVITWYSDETNPKVANYLNISREKETFKLEFHTQKYVEGYDRDSNSNWHIPIRFRNSGSRYDPFNVVFMRMYNNLANVEDSNSIGHQIHIEEYLYEKQKKLIK